MQWFFDIVLGMVANAGYALKTWVMDQINATSGFLLWKINEVRDWILLQFCTSTCKAYKTTDQSIPTGVWTRITFEATNWDVKSEFANYRFKPWHGGYFQVNLAACGLALDAGQRFDIGIFKNGGVYALAREIVPTSVYHGSYLSDLVYLDGDTDYIEGYVYQDAGTAKDVRLGAQYSFMSVHQLSRDTWP